MKECPIIWLEGLIGTGKTKLLKYLVNTLNIRGFDEPFEENPYFADSYDKPEHYAALAQLWFALKRSEIHELATAEALWGNKYDAVIIDRGIIGDNVFENLHYTKGNIKEREHELYNLFYRNIVNRPKACSMLIYLDVFPEIALERIKERGREAEKSITIEYLNELRCHYYDMMLKVEGGRNKLIGNTIVCRIPWNIGHQDPEIVVLSILKEFPHIRRVNAAS